MGRLIQKMDRQPTAWVNAPPINGPIGQRYASHSSPNTDRVCPSLWLPECVCDDGQGYWVEHGRAQTLKGAKTDQLADAMRHTAEQRSRGEQNQANLKNTPPAETV